MAELSTTRSDHGDEDEKPTQCGAGEGQEEDRQGRQASHMCSRHRMSWTSLWGAQWRCRVGWRR